MVGHDGSVSTGCACPNTPEMRAYVRAKYELVAKAGPDFIRVDDDIRMHHHGIAFGCFCQTCLAQFAERAGEPLTREALVQASTIRRPGMTTFKNELGGRVVTMGYAPWVFLHSINKRLQLQNVAEWISRDILPSAWKSPCGWLPWCACLPTASRAR